MNLIMIIRVAFRALVRNKMRAILTMLGDHHRCVCSDCDGEHRARRSGVSSGPDREYRNKSTFRQRGGAERGRRAQWYRRQWDKYFNRRGSQGNPPRSAERCNVDAYSKRKVPTGFGNMNWNTSVQGVSEQYPEVRKWTVQDGSFFTEADVRSAGRVIVLGQTIADSLFPGVDAVGQTLRVANLPFKVVGVMTRKGQDQQGRDQDDIAFTPYTTVQKKILGSPRLQVAYVSAISQDATYTAQEQITELLRQRHKLTSNEPNDFTVRNMTDIAEAANETNNTMTILLACIASVSLLVGGIGIMNIMLVSVTERTREIGIRMAIGARSSAVRSQFLIESIVLSLTGGTIGILLGIIVSISIPKLLGWPTLISTLAIIGSVIFSVAVGVFFGYYPARKAAGLDPIEALRYE